MSEELAVKLAADEEAHLKGSVRKDVVPEEEDDPDLRLALELSKKEAGDTGKLSYANVILSCHSRCPSRRYHV